MNIENTQIAKTPTVVIRKIRDAILDETFKPETDCRSRD
jgi:hypothetical protein